MLAVPGQQDSYGVSGSNRDVLRIRGGARGQETATNELPGQLSRVRVHTQCGDSRERLQPFVSSLTVSARGFGKHQVRYAARVVLSVSMPPHSRQPLTTGYENRAVEPGRQIAHHAGVKVYSRPPNTSSRRFFGDEVFGMRPCVCCGKCHPCIVEDRQRPIHARIWRDRLEMVATRQPGSVGSLSDTAHRRSTPTGRGHLEAALGIAPRDATAATSAR